MGEQATLKLYVISDGEEDDCIAAVSLESLVDWAIGYWQIPEDCIKSIVVLDPKHEITLVYDDVNDVPPLPYKKGSDGRYECTATVEQWLSVKDDGDMLYSTKR